MRFSSVCRAATAALFIIVAGSSAALADILLPSGNCGLAPTNNCLVFDDFTVYSLAVLNQQAGYGPISPSDPYNVDTNGNALQNAIVVATGVGGTAVNNTDVLPIGTVDDAYNTPNAQGGGTTWAGWR